MVDIVSILNHSEPLEGEFAELSALLPLQFYGDRRGTSETEPVRRLMIAMLVDAVRCFRNKFETRQPAGRREFAEVRSWIFSDAEDGPFSFNVVCEELEMDPQALRKGLSAWAKKRPFGERRIIRRSAPQTRQLSASAR
jgi:hypothetical protein